MKKKMKDEKIALVFNKVSNLTVKFSHVKVKKKIAIIFVKLIIHIGNNEVIQFSAKFKEDRIISFWVIVYESCKNMVLLKIQ